jgi:fused signal recognition particle receptor
MGFFQKLKEGLFKTRSSFVADMDAVFMGHEKIDDDFYDDLEETLIMGDIGVHTTEAIIEELKSAAKKEHIKKPGPLREYFVHFVTEKMALPEDAYAFTETTSVVFVIGVNGVGKTTTIGKLAAKLHDNGKKVVIAAADTFRAAAKEQLEVWSERAHAEIIGAGEGADPSSVVFDAIAAAKARNADCLLIDTAGRLNNKKNLMDELSKMNKIIDSHFPEAHRETLVVVDATTGQNALHQAEDFSKVADVTGIVLTKMDGTAKGGIAIAIATELGIPVKYIGIGEKVEDLERFDPEQFAKALFELDESTDDGEA